jgi:hypothetical protein
MRNRRPVLNRYTSLPVALDVLSHKRITLLSPDLWEDRNDAYYLERYREEMGFSCVLAICFSRCGETFHHWRVFSHGFSGVCIEFDRAGLLKSFASQEGFRTGDVSYPWVRTVQRGRPKPETWPFLKRKPYKDEREFRIVFESKTDTARAKHVNIDLAAVRLVTLSPWLPESVANSVTNIIGKIDGCDRLKINRSSLIENEDWKKAIG